MYQKNNFETTVPLDKKRKKDYTESNQVRLQLGAFDDDAVADSAVNYLYDKGNQSKTQGFLQNNGFPSAQDRVFNKQLYGAQEEQKQMRDLLKNRTYTILTPTLPNENDRAFLHGLMGEKEGERDYQKQITDANRAQSDLLSAFRGTQFESSLKPSVPHREALPEIKLETDDTSDANNGLSHTADFDDAKYARPNYSDSGTVASTSKNIAYGANNTANQTKTSGVIRKPGYNKNNRWSENPDMDDYGENSAKYKMLDALDTACANTKDEKQKEKYRKAANMIRGHHTSVDSTSFTKVLLLNNQEGAMTAGHNAVLLLNSANEGALFSFNPEGGSYPWANGQMRVRLLTANQVDSFKKTGNIYDTTSIGYESVVSTSETYSRYIEIPVSKTQGSEMLRGAIKYYVQPGGYGIAGVKQCDNMASSIMSCGNMGYFVFPFPNDSFTNVSEDWGYPIKNIGE